METKNSVCRELEEPYSTAKGREVLDPVSKRNMVEEIDALERLHSKTRESRIEASEAESTRWWE